MESKLTWNRGKVTPSRLSIQSRGGDVPTRDEDRKDDRFAQGRVERRDLASPDSRPTHGRRQSISRSGDDSIQFAGPIQHHDDFLGDESILVVIFDHQKALAVGSDIVISRSRTRGTA